jgi:hypothetical protein
MDGIGNGYRSSPLTVDPVVEIKVYLSRMGRLVGPLTACPRLIFLKMPVFPSSCLLVGIFAAPVWAGLTYPDCSNGPLKSNLVCNTSAAPAARASAVVAAMSNSDKLANLIKSNNPVTYC